MKALTAAAGQRAAAAIALGAGLALVITYLALGGGAYEPLEVADPCEPRALREVEGLERVLERVALSGLDGAACELRVTREELALALSSPAMRSRFAREHGIRGSTLEEVIRSGLRRAVSDAQRAGAVNGIEGSLLLAAVERLPIATLLDVVRGGKRLSDLIREVVPAFR